MIARSSFKVDWCAVSQQPPEDLYMELCAYVGLPSWTPGMMDTEGMMTVAVKGAEGRRGVETRWVIDPAKPFDKDQIVEKREGKPDFNDPVTLACVKRAFCSYLSAGIKQQTLGGPSRQATGIPTQQVLRIDSYLEERGRYTAIFVKNGRFDAQGLGQTEIQAILNLFLRILAEMK